jgi:hypothetical protein
LFCSTRSYEILIQNTDDSEEENNVIPIAGQSVLHLNTKKSYYGKNFKVSLTKYDSTLNVVWQSDYEPGDSYKLEKYFNNNSDIYLLFKETEKKNIKIVKIDLQNGLGQVTETKMLTEIDINFLSALGNKVLIGGQYNNRPVVEFCKLFDKTLKVLPNLNNNHQEINGIDVDESSQIIIVTLIDQRKCKFILSVFDYEGKLINTQFLGEKNKVLLSGKIIKLPNNTLVLTGNFSENCTDYSTGFYVKIIGNDHPINYYKFSELNNFFSYLPEKKQQKIKIKNQIKTEKGKEIKLRYRLNFHNPVVQDSVIQLIAEIYYPEYKVLPYTIRPNINSINNSNTNNEYNNFKYTHAVVCTFDKAGNKLWDYAINLKNIESLSLSEKVKMTKLGNEYLAIYAKDSQINFSKIKSDSLGVNFNLIDLKLKEPDSKLYTSDIFIELNNWYNNVFLAFGEKTIKFENSFIIKEYFYISKLKYTNSKNN